MNISIKPSSELRIKMRSPLTTQRSVPDDFSNYPLWHGHSLDFSKEILCFEADTAGLRCEAPRDECVRASSSPGLAEHPDSTRWKTSCISACIWTETGLWCASEGPQQPPVWDCIFHEAGVAHIWNQQLVGMQHDLESLQTEFPFYIKLASHRTTAVYLLYTLCNFHAHLIRLLGNTISYENSEGWRLLFLFRRQACMLLS